MSLPDCALITPDVPACQVQTPVASTNNEATKTVSANQVAVGTAAGATSVMALTAGGSSGGADWTATDLSPTYAWAAGSQGGEFTLNYPMQAPPSLGGPAPDVRLLYSSGSVDGKTWAKGGQASLVGEGWDLQAGGYIERTFRTCADDGGTGGDMCWIAGGAITMVFNGRSTKLVQDTSGWHASSDDGLKVEPLTEYTAGMGNGARNGEYWKITALDGTQYYFGKHKRYVGDTAATNSTLTVQLANAWTTTPALGGSTYAYPAVGGKAHAVSSVTTSAGGSKAFLYDGAGQTTKVTTNGVATDLVWEDFGKLRSTTVHAAGGDRTTSYVYDAGGTEVMQKTATSRTLYLGGTEVKADGSGTITGVVRSYIVNGAIVATRTNPGGLTWQATDHQGTAAVVIDAVTLQTGIRKQDPFGNARGAAVTWPDSRGFVGGKVEPTGLIQLGARVYDPSIGRFLSPDHLLNIANAEQANGYAYSDNNPTTLSDPTGLERGSSAHDTAVALRMAALKTRFPGALVYGVSEGGEGADLICWGCEPGKVWVWEFKSFDQSPGVGKRSLADGMESAKASALTGDMPVIEGPAFGELMNLPVQTGNTFASNRRVVTVEDSANTRGVQVYWTDEQDKNKRVAAENKRRTDRAREAADEYNDRAEKAGHVPPGSSHGSKGPKPKNNPPKPPQVAGHATNHSTNSPGLGNQQRPSDSAGGP